MARSLVSFALTISSRRADGSNVTRRYLNAFPDMTDTQARFIQDLVNSFDGDVANTLRLTRIDNVDTEEDE